LPRALPAGTLAAMKKPSGFTLIEIVVVLFIMGIVLAMASPHAQRHVERAARATPRRRSRTPIWRSPTS
jgi:prepilin-type N-terminal cleavage/methylation domain-containing protein